MSDMTRRIRWRLADLFSFLACRLRGQRWYAAGTMAACPGNRAAELKQSLWEHCVVLEHGSGNKDAEWLSEIERQLDELGRMAGENWGHWPRREFPAVAPVAPRPDAARSASRATTKDGMK